MADLDSFPNGFQARLQKLTERTRAEDDRRRLARGADDSWRMSGSVLAMLRSLTGLTQTELGKALSDRLGTHVGQSDISAMERSDDQEKHKELKLAASLYFRDKGAIKGALEKFASCRR
jgi:hypothetical protein